MSLSCGPDNPEGNFHLGFLGCQRHVRRVIRKRDASGLRNDESADTMARRLATKKQEPGFAENTLYVYAPSLPGVSRSIDHQA